MGLFGRRYSVGKNDGLMLEKQFPVLLFLIPFLSAFLLPFVSWIHRSFIWPFILAILGTTTVLACQALYQVFLNGDTYYAMGGWAQPMGIEWCLDLTGAVMVTLIALVAFVVLFTKGPGSRTGEQKNISLLQYILSLLLISGLIGQLLTRDLFNLYVFLEVTSLSAYGLVSSGNKKSIWTGYRYLLIGTIGASFYLLGVGYLYAATGSLNMADIAGRIPSVGNPPLILTAFVLIFCGLAIKMGLFPFHSWLPDAYTYAPDWVSSLIAPVMTKVAIFVFIHILCFIFTLSFVNQYLPLFHIMCIISSIAIIFGSVNALLHTDFKRILAYSSISHIGLIVLGIGINNSTALSGSMMHIVNHAIMKATLFLVASFAFTYYGIRNISDLYQLRNSPLYIRIAFTLSALSMVGIPPMCGFFSKWYIVLGAIKAGYHIYAVIIVVGSLLTALYFFRIFEQIFLGKKPLQEATVKYLPFNFSLSFFALSLILVGITSPWIYYQLSLLLNRILS